MNPKVPRIAIVDDEEFVCRALGRLLRSAGFLVETFASGTDFLARLRKPLPDCIVLDVHMPLLDGFEVAAQLARDGHAIPVIVITGHDTQESRDRAAAQHISYLRKPIDDQLLIQSVHDALAGNATDVA